MGDELVRRCLHRAKERGSEDVQYAVNCACHRYLLLCDAAKRNVRSFSRVGNPGTHLHAIRMRLQQRLQVYVGPLGLWLYKPGDPHRGTRHTK